MKITIGLKWLLVLMMVFGVAPVSASDPGIRSKEEALKRALEFPFVPDDAVLTYSAQSKDAKGDTVWDFTLQRSYPDSEDFPAGSYSVRLRSSDGAPRQLSVSDKVLDREYGQQPAGDSKMDAAKAAEIAGTFIRGLDWGLDADWRLNPYPDSDSGNVPDDRSKFRVSFVRFVNGIRFPGDGFIVYVNPDGTIFSYAMNWSAGPFADPIGIVTQSKAEQIFRNNSRPVLYYLNLEKPKLVYGQYLHTLSAKDGNPPPEWNFNPYPGSGKWKPIVSKPLAPLITNAKLTDKQMREKARRLLGIAGPHKVSNPSPGFYRFSVATKDPKYTLVMDVIYNLNTGQVESLGRNGNCYDYDPKSTGKAEIGENKARQISEAFIKTAMPAYADKLKETDFRKNSTGGTKPCSIYILSYNRVADGIAVADETVQIVISAGNGTIQAVESSLSQRSYPAKATVKISEDEAAKKLLSLYDVVLTYQRTSAGSLELFYTLMLKPSVPRFNNGRYGFEPVLDAGSGAWLNMDGDPVKG
ncbi:hypothetical protein GE107_05430 [Cohnella sp. CFH 77786]|uniref:YcdB/YcdC domain-containing protein n=1 Tax=Cohnella sp. CFH 77786 TaxID=2662265 RepID=UPI001C60C10C|nr:YcdB/YcdC domain-containing protein [Cohnella sp. CFH 77786]MBW5445503.1 hypothetical protein [Cohnella sp. CFH 77786]